MKPIPLNAADLAQLRAEYNNAGHGAKQKVIAHWGTKLDASPKSLQNLIYRGSLRKPSVKELSQEKQGYAAIVGALFNRSPLASRMGKVIDWVNVVRLAEELGEIPTGAFTAREMSLFSQRFRLTGAHRVTGKFRRTTPNSLHQIDFSRSLILVPAGSGEWGSSMVQVLSRSQVPYLNKPQEGMRVWFGAMKDDASGLVFMRYYIARGEGNEQAIQLMHDAWERKLHYPFCGIPQDIYRDNVRWGLTEQVQCLLKKLGVQDITTSEAEQPWKKGKVEREFRTIKRKFENELGGGLGKGALLSLTDANTKLALACMEINQRAHPDFAGYTRLSYWRAHVKEVWFPENFKELAYQQHKGMVRHGRIRFNRRDYWAPHDVVDGTQVELVVLSGQVYLFHPGDRFGPARRTLLHEARLNQAPPVDPQAQEIAERMTDIQQNIKPISGERYDEILLDRLGDEPDFTPPPAAAAPFIQGAGTELLSGRAQREVLVDVLGPLCDLDPLTKTELDKFCARPHSHQEITRYGERVLKILNSAPTKERTYHGEAQTTE